MEMELRFNPTDIQANEDGSMTVSGYVNKTEMCSSMLGREQKFKEIIKRGAWQRAVDSAKEIHFLAEHDPAKILASTRNNSLQLEEDEVGLKMTATISPTSWGKDYYQLIKDGIYKNMSFGFRALKDSWRNMGNYFERTVNDLQLFEVSVVRDPAYAESSISARGIDLVEDIVPEEVINKVEEKVEDKVEERDVNNLAESIAEKIYNLLQANNSANGQVVTADGGSVSGEVLDDETPDEEAAEEAMPTVSKMLHVHADLFVQYMQVRHHHWNVQGSTFRDVHLMFDEASETLLEAIDNWAERIVPTGAIVPMDLGTLAELSDIEMIDDSVRDPQPMIAQVLAGLADINEDLGNVAADAKESGEVGLEQLAGDLVVGFEKLIYKFQQFLNLSDTTDEATEPVDAPDEQDESDRSAEIETDVEERKQDDNKGQEKADLDKINQLRDFTKKFRKE